MAQIALELLLDNAVELQREGMILAGGSTPGRSRIYECMLSDFEWTRVRERLEQKKSPYKVKNESSFSLVGHNSPDW